MEPDWSEGGEVAQLVREARTVWRALGDRMETLEFLDRDLGLKQANAVLAGVERFAEEYAAFLDDEGRANVANARETAVRARLLFRSMAAS